MQKWIPVSQIVQGVDDGHIHFLTRRQHLISKMFDHAPVHKERPTHRVARMRCPPMGPWGFGLQQRPPNFEIFPPRPNPELRPKPQKKATLMLKEEIITETPQKPFTDFHAFLPGAFDIIKRGTTPGITIRDGKVELL